MFFSPTPALTEPRARASLVRTFARGVFVLAAGYALTQSLLPSPTLPFGLNVVDKVQHVAAFYALSLLALVAFPSAPAVLTLGAVMGFGLMIEILQAIPVFGRDPSWLDLAANALGALLAIGPFVASGVRDWLRSWRLP